VELGSRAISGKKILTKATAFKCATAGAKGILSGAITGAVMGSVFPGVGTVAGFVIGLGVGIAASYVVDAATKPAEDWAMNELGIKDDE
jgi:fructose-specific phosphotransferase system IIC component